MPAKLTPHIGPWTNTFLPGSRIETHMPKKTIWLIDKLLPLGLTDDTFKPLHHLSVTISAHRDHCMGVSSFNGVTNDDVRDRLDYIYLEIVRRGFKDIPPPEGLLENLADEALHRYPMRFNSQREPVFGSVQPTARDRVSQAETGTGSGMSRLDTELLSAFMTGFHGYGNLQGDYWFIGMEEGGGSTFAEVERRLLCWDQRGRMFVEDLADFHEAFGEQRWFSWRQLQPTWSKLIRLLLRATGEPHDDENVRSYQVDKLGRTAGATCLLELMPLPSQSVEHWQYGAWSDLPSLRSRETYWKALMGPRAARLKDLLVKYHPRIVVFYGREYENLWAAVCPPDTRFQRFQIADNQSWKIAQLDRSIYVLCSHPTARGLSNNYFIAIGRKIRELYRSL